MRYKYIDEDKQHLHTLDDKPLIGTSSALKVLAKPLTWWASGLACEKLGWMKKADTRKNTKEEVELNKVCRLEKASSKLCEIKGLSTEDFLTLLDNAYKAHTVKLNESADKGVDLHAELERFVKESIRGNELYETRFERFDAKIHPFMKWADKNVEKFIASEVHCYSEVLWTGGICDCVAMLKNGNLAIVDFKSSKEAYDSQFIQCAGYALQLEENGMWDRNGKVNKKLDGEIKELVVFPFGAKEITANERFNVGDFKEGFKHAVALYKLLEIK